jgi:thiosulfate reductase cytochrome b subunit
MRLCHWLNAFAMVCMFMSGWGIYNASPLFGFDFPEAATVGGWLGGSIAWHLGAMWLLVVNGVFYVSCGVLSGHFRRRWLPLKPADVGQDLGQAMRFRLPHKAGSYNAVQKLMYWGVLCLGVLMVLSGLAIWKPVQLAPLTDLLGGFAIARYVHFTAMAAIGAFVVIHLLLVLLVPRTLPPMIFWRSPRPGPDRHA